MPQQGPHQAPDPGSQQPPHQASPEDLRLDVVAVGAHPDDAEIACGGTLARLAAQGYRVGIIDLTDGEPTPLSPGPHVRLEEARRAAGVLGVTTRVTLDLPNRRLFDGFEARVKLATQLRQFRPSVVIGFGEKTPLASPDHWQAMQITDAAVFYSRLTKWDDSFDGLPPHTVATQLYFSFALTSLEMAPGAGHIVADISDTLEAKIESVRCYETQFPKEKSHVFERIRTFAYYYGRAAGLQAGELFTSPRMLGTQDLMKAVLP